MERAERFLLAVRALVDEMRGPRPNPVAVRSLQEEVLNAAVELPMYPPFEPPATELAAPLPPAVPPPNALFSSAGTTQSAATWSMELARDLEVAYARIDKLLRDLEICRVELARERAERAEEKLDARERETATASALIADRSGHTIG
jgi:hypothetical protein